MYAPNFYPKFNFLKLDLKEIDVSTVRQLKNHYSFSENLWFKKNQNPYFQPLEVHNRFEIHDIEYLGNKEFLVDQSLAKSDHARRPFSQKLQKLKLLFNLKSFVDFQIRPVQFDKVKELVFKIDFLDLVAFQEFMGLHFPHWTMFAALKSGFFSRLF